MRNMIFKTLFASILGSFLVAPLAHADRQGGGTLRQVSFNANEGFTYQPNNGTEYVRFRYTKGDQVAFAFVSTSSENFVPAEVQMHRAELTMNHSALVRALLVSKKFSTWQTVNQWTTP